MSGVLNDYRSEILRWNRRFNLVSRVDPEVLVDALLTECREALAMLSGAGIFPLPEAHAEEGVLSPATPFVDIGSGAGFPGLVWALQLAEENKPCRALLVEPRERRAWFLNRCRRMLGSTGVAITTGRWGEPITRAAVGRLLRESSDSPDLIVTLKALRLGDAEILSGLPARTLAPGQRISVVRFVRGKSRHGSGDPGGVMRQMGRHRDSDLAAGRGRIPGDGDERYPWALIETLELRAPKTRFADLGLQVVRYEYGSVS